MAVNVIIISFFLTISFALSPEDLPSEAKNTFLQLALKSQSAIREKLGSLRCEDASSIRLTKTGFVYIADEYRHSRHRRKEFSRRRKKIPLHRASKTSQNGKLEIRLELRR